MRTWNFEGNERVKSVTFVLLNHAMDNAYLRKEIKNRVGLLVLRLEDPDINNITKELGNNPQLQVIYVSNTFAKRPALILPTPALDKTYVVSRFALKNDLNLHLRRFNVWEKFRKIDIKDQRTVSNVYFSAMAVTTAFRNTCANLSRDYLIERIEHMLERPVFHSVFPPFTLGADQRFASKGSFIIGPLILSDNISTLPREWIVP